jgi:formylglycine-generating enzyme required for sulfatase activity/nitrate/TMAO reductase-like tetraheme cytochrome c subunit
MGLFGKKGSSEMKGRRRKSWALITLGAAILYILFIAMKVGIEQTSSDEFCMSCHVHTHADNAWKLSTHFDNSSGVIVHCIDCHLPPKTDIHRHIWWKAYFGAKDVFKFYFTDTDKINWEAKGDPEVATHFTFMETCTGCHSNLFPSTLSEEGGDAHLHYQQNIETITCLNCHITVGHYDENNIHAHNVDFGVEATVDKEVYLEPAVVEAFDDYTEFIPGSTVSFDMVAVPGGTFTMGSPEKEKYRDEDEGPQVSVEVSDFWMGKAEVSWDEFLAFYAQTATVGREVAAAEKDAADVDAISGPTAPWGAPDQGWGKGQRPAITMSFHAAEVYCQWLTQVTGKKYRLPTEAEWEYAVRGGTTTPYFFEGTPGNYTSQGWKNKLFGPDTETITQYAVYVENSGSKTVEPSDVEPNPFGLLNLSGNVWEFVSDFYAPDMYGEYAGQGSVRDPKGPAAGEEHVIRGGAYDSDAIELRSANRDYTRTEQWLVTDPQIPKSIWWYSDSKNVGFRVVCEPQQLVTKNTDQ